MCLVMGWLVTSHHTTQSGPYHLFHHTWTLCSFLLIICIWNSCIYPEKKEVFPPEFRLSSFCLIISPCSTLYLCPPLYFQLASCSHTVPNLHFAPSCTPCYHARRLSIMLKWNKVRCIPIVNRTFWLRIVSDHCAVHTCANDIITNCGLVMRSNSLTNGWLMYHVMDTT